MVHNGLPYCDGYFAPAKVSTRVLPSPHHECPRLRQPPLLTQQNSRNKTNNSDINITDTDHTNMHTNTSNNNDNNLDIHFNIFFARFARKTNKKKKSNNEKLDLRNGQGINR